MTSLKSALLLCHVRSSNTRRTLNKLQEFGIERVYVSIDGPRNFDDSELQEKLHNELDLASQYFEKFEVKKSAYNHGIAVAVITALDWFFCTEEAGVIIEDDLEFDLDFLRYVEAGLNLYISDQNVWMICGSRLIPRAEKYEKFENRELMSNYPIIWGWGTWADRWGEILSAMFRLPEPKRGIPCKVKSFWKVGHKRVSQGLVDTWDIPLAASMRFLGKKSLIPPVNLVSNVGFDQFASNEMNPGFPLGIPLEHLPKNWAQNRYVGEVISLKTEEVDSIFEEEVFRIKHRHYFLELYSLFLDPVKKIKLQKLPIVTRLEKVDSKFGKLNR
jgi:hypothetical protein